MVSDFVYLWIVCVYEHMCDSLCVLFLVLFLFSFGCLFAYCYSGLFVLLVYLFSNKRKKEGWGWMDEEVGRTLNRQGETWSEYVVWKNHIQLKRVSFIWMIFQDDFEVISKQDFIPYKCLKTDIFPFFFPSYKYYPTSLKSPILRGIY